MSEQPPYRGLADWLPSGEDPYHSIDRSVDAARFIKPPPRLYRLRRDLRDAYWKVRGRLRAWWRLKVRRLPPEPSGLRMADFTAALKKHYSPARLTACTHYPPPERCGPMFIEDDATKEQTP